MTFSETIILIKTDKKKYAEPFWKSLFFIHGFKYTLEHRCCYFCYTHKWLPIFVILWLYEKHLIFLLGRQTAWIVQLPEDFVIAHFGGITFFPKKCGKHIYLRQGITVGNSKVSGGGHPCIGDNVTFEVNAIVIGPISIGNNVIIGANAVVNKDVPDNCIVAGIPATIIKTLTPNE